MTPKEHVEASKKAMEETGFWDSSQSVGWNHDPVIFHVRYRTDENGFRKRMIDGFFNREHLRPSSQVLFDSLDEDNALDVLRQIFVAECNEDYTAIPVGFKREYVEARPGFPPESCVCFCFIDSQVYKSVEDC